MVPHSVKLLLQISILVALLLALFLLFFDLPPRVSAQVAVFYPATCLGGWKYVAQAGGPPEVTFDVPYDDKNSAILEDVVTQIYCGSFIGEFPPQSKHTKVTLRFSWHEESVRNLVGEEISEIEKKPRAEASVEAETVENGEVVTDPMIDLLVATSSLASITLTSIIESNRTPSSESLEDIDLNEDLLETFLGTSSAMIVAEGAPTSTTTLPPEVSETTPSEEIIDPEPAEVLGTSVEEAVSKEELVTEPPTEDILLAPEKNTREESGPVSWWRNLLVPNVYAEETDDISVDIPQDEAVVVEVAPGVEVDIEEVETTSKELVDSTVVPAGARFEVRYTLDNENWSTLGYVSEVTNDVRFVFPEEVFKSVVDIEKVQIALVTLPQIDEFRRVYLDAMWLEVVYEKVLQLGVYAVLTEPLRTVSALPTFVVGSTTGTGSSASTGIDVMSPVVEQEEMVAEEGELENTTVATTSEALLIHIDEVLSLKGISDRLVLLTRTTSSMTELWLIDLVGVKSTLIGSGETAVGTYPVASKDSIIFWRGSSGDIIFSYDLRTGGTRGRLMVVANLPEQTNFPRFTFPFTEWEVILGNDRFNFYSRRTGEVFSDEDTMGVVNFLAETNLSQLGSSEYFENLGIYPNEVESEPETVISI